MSPAAAQSWTPHLPPSRARELRRTMPTRVAINGFGRIGRQVLRRTLGDDDLEGVTINSVRANPEICAHLFKYDSVFGRYPGDVDTDETNLVVDGRTIRITDQRDPLLCP